MYNVGCNELLSGIYSCNLGENSFCVGMDTCSIISVSSKFRDTPFSLNQGTSCDKLGQAMQSIHEVEWKNVDAKSTTNSSKSLRTSSISFPVKSSQDTEQECSNSLPTCQPYEIEPCKPIESPQATATSECRADAWQAELERAVMLLDAFCIVDRGFIPEDD
jgi:hypothetical protein